MFYTCKKSVKLIVEISKAAKYISVLREKFIPQNTYIKKEGGDSLDYRNISYSFIPKKNPIKKWSEDLNRHSSIEDRWPKNVQHR